jgi:hypothetical protein
VQSAIANGHDGSGVPVAIIDAYASPTIESDANTYFSRHGLPTFKGGQFSQVVAPGTYRRPENPRQDPQGWYGEETLDVEAVHTMAPGAKVVFVGAPNNYQDLDAAMNHVVSQHLADLVTNSYGFTTEALPPGFIKPFNAPCSKVRSRESASTFRRVMTATRPLAVRPARRRPTFRPRVHGSPPSGVRPSPRARWRIRPSTCSRRAGAQTVTALAAPVS